MTPPNAHTPFTVIAHVQQGVALDARFGVALDGLLASVIRDRAKGTHGQPGLPLTGSQLDGGLTAAEPSTTDLPLSRCTLDPTDWHWLATTAYPVDHHRQPVVGDPDVHHHHTRPRERVIAAVATRIPTTMPPSSGRYRMRRLPVVTIPAAAVIWRGVGDPHAVRDLLADIPAIGSRRGTGEGTILKWEIDAEPDADPALHGHCHPDHSIGRPIPPTCAKTLHLPAHRLGHAGLRPPYWHPATQRSLLLPEPLQGGN